MLGSNLNENKNNNVKISKTIKKVVNGKSENPEVVEETVYYDEDEVKKFESFENQDFGIDKNASNLKKNVTVEEDESGTVTKVVNIEYSLLEDDINNEGDVIIETSYINDGDFIIDANGEKSFIANGEKSFIANMDSVLMNDGGVSFISKEEAIPKINAKIEKLETIEEKNKDILEDEKDEEVNERSFIQQVKSVFTGGKKKTTTSEKVEKNEKNW